METGHDDYGRFYLNSVAERIDHTLLRQDVTKKDILKLCAEAEEHGFYSVCVFPNQVKCAAKELKKSKVKVCTVVDFPFGESTPRVKAFAAREARFNGADEIDAVMTVSAAKCGDWRYIEKEVREINRSLKDGMILKIIIESGSLSDEECARAAVAVSRGGADFVKTSTGVNGPGADTRKIKIIKEALEGTQTRIKASGGIKTLDDVIAMVNAGADRIGTSSGIAIISTPVTREYIMENDWAARSAPPAPAGKDLAAVRSGELENK